MIDVILFAETWSQALGCKWTSGMAQPCCVGLLIIKGSVSLV